VLDIREVFDRLSATAQKALPHDLLLLRTFNDDFSKVKTYAHTGDWQELELDLALPYPPAVIRAWNFDVLDDTLLDSRVDDMPGSRRGMRSILRFPIRFGDRLIGAIGIMSTEPSKYSGEDVIIGRRLVDHMAVALSHQRLAEEVRRNEEVRTRAE